MQRCKRHLESIVRRGFPYVQVAYQRWLLAYNVAYLFGKIPYWRPWLRWMRVDMRRMQGHEQPLVAGASAKRLPPIMQYPALFVWLLLRKGTAGVMDMLKYALPASIFFFKFLEWWYSPQNRRRRGGSDDGARRHVNPPAVLPPSERGVLFTPPDTYEPPAVLSRAAESASDTDVSKSTLLHNGCPLCGVAPIQNPCVLTTGYAFCFRCAHAYVDKWMRCPITLLPLPGGIEQIRKVLV